MHGAIAGLVKPARQSFDRADAESDFPRAQGGYRRAGNAHFQQAIDMGLPHSARRCQHFAGEVGAGHRLDPATASGGKGWRILVWQR